jgi:ketosteroid isomerase-like protein
MRWRSTPAISLGEVDARMNDPTATDRQAIAQVLQNYAMHLDAFEFEPLSTVFADDVIARYTTHLPMASADEVTEFLRERTAVHDWMHHQLTVVSIEIDGDSATTLTYFTAHSRYAGEPVRVSISVGEYHDVLRRVDGRWRICERGVHLGWREIRTN